MVWVLKRFEQPKHMLQQMNKKIITTLHKLFPYTGLQNFSVLNC